MDIPRSLIVPSKYDFSGIRPDDENGYNQDLEISNYGLSSQETSKQPMPTKKNEYIDNNDVNEYGMILENISLASNCHTGTSSINGVSRNEQNFYYDLEASNEPLITTTDITTQSNQHVDVGISHSFNDLPHFPTIDSNFDSKEENTLGTVDLNNLPNDSFELNYQQRFKDINETGLPNAISSEVLNSHPSTDVIKQNVTQSEFGTKSDICNISSLIPEYGLLDRGQLVNLNIDSNGIVNSDVQEESRQARNTAVGNEFDDIGYLPANGVENLVLNNTASTQEGQNRTMESFNLQSGGHNNELWGSGLSNSSLTELLFSDTSFVGVEKTNQLYTEHRHSASLPELFATSMCNSVDSITGHGPLKHKRDLSSQLEARKPSYNLANSSPYNKSKRASAPMPFGRPIHTNKRHSNETKSMTHSRSSSIGARTVSRKRARKNKGVNRIQGDTGNGSSSYTSSASRSSASSRSSRSNSISPCEPALYESDLLQTEPNNTSNNSNGSETANTAASQKGDTITLRQPSFAEGREDVGSFGFINFRKPGAWTRVKPHRNDSILDERD
ncbi:hypothetical protein AWJ20_2887 [Sugiyamaella lignohabitans]|uniref:Uncharacterized protein n=1 Tax=Sugiyamaella lignohabitans TaxID=796027 RepID=A0A167FG91_9ASCO|nr:uncharacterized protein AWJ20_2887 [Sugiyamaella lignohabitans]ANB15261.1 hypothetical protein AWJ20_2887 [Sugiyamaella lignohabitans]